ncbi:hypothetical protein [Actinophytocola sp. KF-1]
MADWWFKLLARTAASGANGSSTSLAPCPTFDRLGRAYRLRLTSMRQPVQEARVAKRHEEEGDDRDDRSRAGRNRDCSPARLSTIGLVIQIIALIRMIIEYLDH